MVEEIKMKIFREPRKGIVLVALAFILGALGPGKKQGRKIVLEGTEWTDIWIPGAADQKAVKVLLIGDSICKGYYGTVVRELKGNALVARLATSMSVCDPLFLPLLDQVLSHQKYKVVCFNNGLHGFGYTENEYKEGLARALKYLLERSKGARVFFVTTTPMRKGDGGDERPGRVIERNRIASRLCRKLGIGEIDLFSLMEGKEDLHTDAFHFKRKAKVMQGKTIAGKIRKSL